MQFLSRQAFAKRADLSPSSIKRFEKLDGFPQKVQISPGRIGFVESEIDAWIKARIRERNAALGIVTDDDDEEEGELEAEAAEA